jgi:hypothetical protein
VVHVLVREGASTRRLWSQHSKSDLWQAAAAPPPRAAALPGDASFSFSIVADAAAAAGAAAAAAPSEDASAGLSASLAGLPLPALALVADFSTDAALQALLAASSAVRRALADEPSFWLQRLRRLPAFPAWQRTAAAAAGWPRE